MPKKTNFDPKRNARLAWIAMNGFGQGKTDAKIIIELMTAFPGTSEQTARGDLKALYQRYYDINQDNVEHASAQALEQAWDCYEKCIKLCQMSAAVKILEHIHKLLGLSTDSKSSNKFGDQAGQGQATPAPDIIRERIAKLMKNKQVQEQAQEAGIDLKDLAVKAGVD